MFPATRLVDGRYQTAMFPCFSTDVDAWYSRYNPRRRGLLHDTSDVDYIGRRHRLGYGLLSCFLCDFRLQSSLVVLLVLALVAAAIVKNERWDAIGNR